MGEVSLYVPGQSGRFLMGGTPVRARAIRALFYGRGTPVRARGIRFRPYTATVRDVLRAYSQICEYEETSRSAVDRM